MISVYISNNRKFRRLMTEDTYPVVALNGIPRGLCHDFNVEEGWIQYRVPKSGLHKDYSNPEVELELRRYHGKVEILGYGGNNPTDKFYDNLPECTPLLPVEDYKVIEDYEVVV